MLEIRNLKVSVKSLNEVQLINGVNLNIKNGEIHAIMGTNGSGKSTLSKVLAGHPSYKILKGEIIFQNQNINNYSSEERSQMGLFLAFQYPIEIPGVTNEEFLRIADNSKRKASNLEPLNTIEFFDFMKKNLEESEIPLDFLIRNVNEGF